MKPSTSFKIACGYFLLVCLLIGSIAYIYRQTSSLVQVPDSEQEFAERRKATNQLVSRLFEAENIGQAIRFGQWEAYRGYVRALDGARAAILRLDTLFADSLQQARLDTLATLLQEKQDNMRRLVAALENNRTGEIYRNQVNLFIQHRDTVVERPALTRQVIQEDKSYTIEEPRKNFFQRLAAAFRKPQADTTEVKQTVQVITTDTIRSAFNPADTLAHLLDSIESDMQQYASRRRQRINAQAERLWANGIELNNRVTLLLETIEAEEQHRLEAESLAAHRMRREAAITTGGIATVAVLLAIIFFIIVWRDITRSNHYRRELEKAKQKAEDLLVSREKLMLTVTHDIKAPVGSIMGYIDLLSPHVADGRLRHYIDNMRNSSGHLLALVGSLLDYHKLEAHKMDVRPVDFNPSTLLHTIAQEFLPLAEKKGLALQCETSDETDNFYTGDAFRIRQIVENLTSNALKFTQEGNITIRAKMHGRQLCLTVEDTGCGMTADEQKLIFKEFTRLRSAQGEEGVGLGLSITLKLVQLLQGEIQLQSTPGKGSSFFVMIPLRPSATPGNPETGKTAEAPRRPATPPLDILLIDDDAIQLQLTRAMLENLSRDGLPCATACCRTPEEVFSLVATRHFDLLLTDIQMPAMNGFELLRQVKNLKNGAALPVVAITARNDMDEESFRRHGFATCLYKPFNQHDLSQAIRKALGHTMEETPQATGRPAALAAGHIDFSPLTAFAGDDREAARRILDTFLQETTRHAEAFTRAMREKDKAGACRLAHKMLPTFTLIGAPCATSMRLLEQRREEPEWTEADDAPAKEIAAALPLVVRLLQARLS